MKRGGQWVAAALAALSLILGLLYALVTPPFETPDEVPHFYYIVQLRNRHTLPEQSPGVTNMAHHPPLYYLLAALVTLPADTRDTRGGYVPNWEFALLDNGENNIPAARHDTDVPFPYVGQALALRLARLFSVALGAATVWMVIRIGWLIFPDQPHIGVVAGLLAALNPQLLFIAGAVNNDNLLKLALTAFCLVMVYILQTPQQAKLWLLAGCCITVATLTRVNGLLYAPVVALTLAIFAVRQRSLRFFLVNGALAAAPVLGGAGWWFLRNWRLYGDLTGWSRFHLNYDAVMRKNALTAADVLEFFNTQIDSFWGIFGWMNVFAPAWYYLAVRLLCAAALAGLALFLVRRRRALSGFQRAALALLFAMALIAETFQLLSIRTFNESWYQGRYLFSVLAPLTLLAATGLTGLLSPRSGKWAAVALGTALLAAALYMPFYVIAPAYSTVEIISQGAERANTQPP